MRPGDAEMVQKFGKAGFDRRAFSGVGDSCYDRSPLFAVIADNSLDSNGRRNTLKEKLR
jgi:hypothetical protein